MRELARLADGSLQGRARTRSSRRSQPPRRSVQRSSVSAPRWAPCAVSSSRHRSGLRARIQSQAGGTSPLVRRPRLAFGGALAAAAVAAVLLALVLLPSGAGGPTVVQAAQLSRLPATASVQVAPSNPKLLAASVEGVPFPNWTKEFGWRQAGSGPTGSTVAIPGPSSTSTHGKRLAYTIISGDGIGPPSGARASNVNGVSLHSTSDQGRRIVTWWRDGRTCVLSGSGVSDAELLKLASWKGDGAVPF